MQIEQKNDGFDCSLFNLIIVTPMVIGMFITE